MEHVQPILRARTLQHWGLSFSFLKLFLPDNGCQPPPDRPIRVKGGRSGPLVCAVVSNFCSFDKFTLEGKNRCIEIEQKAIARSGEIEHLFSGYIFGIPKT